MTEKLCANCGELNSQESNFCAHCGFSEFNDIPPGLHDRLADNTDATRNPAVIISTTRLIIGSFLSSGLYFFYWFYLTWKQISSEVEGENYPFWHVMALNLPIYGFFRMHAHMRTINELASQHGIVSTVAPGLAVLLFLLANILGWAIGILENIVAVAVMNLISITLLTVIMTMGQGVLNLYWEKSFPANTLRFARIGAGEITIVVIGFLLWIVLLIPPSVYEQPESGF
jgi:hypothetical protein